MNKYTWMIIALILAVAAGLLIKDGNDQPVMMQAVKYIRQAKMPTTDEAMSGAMADTGAVDEAMADTGAVVDAGADEAVVDTGANEAVVDTGANEAVVDAGADEAAVEITQ